MFCNPTIELWGICYDTVTTISINRTNEGLEGTIPTEIGQFPNLEYLTLSYNNLTGPLPPEVFASNRLKKVNIRDN